MALRRIDHPRFRAAVRQVEDSIDAAWRDFRDSFGAAAGTADEAELTATVLNDPGDFPWRIVDAALDRKTCRQCGSRLGAGPVGCDPCDLANGFRFAGLEVDRPGVLAGNEHALRVAAAVARTRHRYTPRARCGYELVLPELLAGGLPTTAAAQRAKALINSRTDDELEHLITIEDLTADASSPGGPARRAR